MLDKVAENSILWSIVFLYTEYFSLTPQLIAIVAFDSHFKSSSISLSLPILHLKNISKSFYSSALKLERIAVFHAGRSNIILPNIVLQLIMEKSCATLVLGVLVRLKRVIQESVWFCLQQYCSSKKNDQVYLRY